MVQILLFIDGTFLGFWIVGHGKKRKAPVLNFSECLELENAFKYIDLVIGQQGYTPYENIKKNIPSILMESESHDYVR